MRLHISFDLRHNIELPFDHHHALQACIYAAVGRANSAYASFLHDRGYAEREDSVKTSKLFCFGGLRAPAENRTITANGIRYESGPINWDLASPSGVLEELLACNVLQPGSHLNIHSAELIIRHIRCDPSPPSADNSPYRCLSPIVAARGRPDGTTEYLRPDDPEFSQTVRANLLWKHRVMYGNEPQDSQFEMRFSQSYLQNPRSRGGTRLINYKGIRLVGALAPFILTTSPEMLKLAWECGLGSRNSMGLGMVEAAGQSGQSSRYAGSNQFERAPSALRTASVL